MSERQHWQLRELGSSGAGTSPGAALPGGVWVFAEQWQSRQLHPVVAELLGAGRQLADQLAQPLTAVMLGHADITELAPALQAYPVDQIVIVATPELGTYCAESFSNILAELVQAHQVEIVLAGATAIGRSLLPRVAARLRTGLTADCTALEITAAGLLLQTRPAFGGNVMAEIECPVARPQMATVRPRVLPPAEPGTPRPGRIWQMQPTPGLLARRSETLEFLPMLATSLSALAAADIVVAGGRGLGGAAEFKLVFTLAKALGAAVAASRAAVDAGWIPYQHQVGQTGLTITPKVYIACGISGAIQHLVGMSKAATIIAINRDRGAPIFGAADLGIVGDVFEVVPALLDQVARQPRLPR